MRAATPPAAPPPPAGTTSWFSPRVPSLLLTLVAWLALAFVVWRASMRWNPGRALSALARSVVSPRRLGAVAVALLVFVVPSSCRDPSEGARQAQIEPRFNVLSGVWAAGDREFLHQGFSFGPAMGTSERPDGGEVRLLFERRTTPFGAPIDGVHERDDGSYAVERSGMFERERLGSLNKEHDPDSGYSYHGARWFAPTLARWMTPDPLYTQSPEAVMADPWQANPYAYVSNDPVGQWDPTGLVGGGCDACDDRTLGLGMSTLPGGPSKADIDAFDDGLAQGHGMGAVVIATGLVPPAAWPLLAAASANMSGGPSVGDILILATDGIGKLAGKLKNLWENPRLPESPSVGAAPAAEAAGGLLGKADDAAGGIARPKGVPADWVAKPSKTGDGTRFVDPANPHNSVRVMPGDPKSPFPNSQRPYVRHLKDGQSLDVNGNVVPKNTPEAHIPLEDFVWPF